MEHSRHNPELGGPKTAFWSYISCPKNGPFQNVSGEDITFDLRDRDEIPQVLIGLQAIYKNPVTRKQVFDILWKILPDSTSFNNGRPGMNLWEILVLGTLRLACNWDFDKIRNIANKHVDVG